MNKEKYNQLLLQLPRNEVNGVTLNSEGGNLSGSPPSEGHVTGHEADLVNNLLGREEDYNWMTI